MLGESKFKEVYIACGYTDLCYGIDWLATNVKEKFGLNPFTQQRLKWLYFKELPFFLQ